MIERWRESFRDNPRQAITDLFSGRAGLGSSLRLDVPELLYQEFPPDAAERGALDEALLHWLHAMRKDYAAQVQRLGFSVYGKRLCDALIAVQLLELPRTTYQIRETLDPWLDWLTPLRLAPERDPALECWRVLTRRQADTHHAAAWLRLATDPRPEYLGVALAGLQRLPNQGDAQFNQGLMLLALLRHAVRLASTQEALKLFNRRYSALRGLYPAGPQHWQEVLEQALNAFYSEAKQGRAKELLNTLREPPKSKYGKKYERTHIPQPADPNDTDRLFYDILHSRGEGERLTERLLSILEQNYRYATMTGDSSFFAFTLSKHGTQLLKRYALAQNTLERLNGVIERALIWKPMDSYIWMIWANVLGHRQKSLLQEWVLRETVRLFPGHDASRVELARMLIRYGEDRWDEAESWLHTVIECNPQHEHSRVELARLLLLRGEDNRDKAEQWLRQAAERSPQHEYSRVELARLLINRGKDRWDEADNWLREVIERNRQNEPARVELARLLIRRGEDYWDEAECWLMEVVKQQPNNEHSRVELAKLLIRRGENHWDDAERWLLQVVNSRPKHGPSRVVLAGLLSLRGRLTDAIKLLKDFLDHFPQDCIARRFLEQLETGSFDYPSWIDSDDGNYSYRSQTPRGNSSSDALRRGPLSGQGGIPTPSVGTMPAPDDEPQPADSSTVFAELERRARLQSEFTRAQYAKTQGKTEATEQIDHATAQGDALAGLFHQWLNPDDNAEPPPNAWAWRACRLYQQAANPEDWKRLEDSSPEHRMETRFLRLLTLPETSEHDEETRRFRQRLTDEDGEQAQSPLERFMLDALNRPPSPDSALAVLSSAAVDPPQFAMWA